MLRDVTSPFSGRDSWQDGSSEDSRRYDSPQPPSGRQTPNTTLSSMLLSPQESRIDLQPTQPLADAARTKSDIPAVELPADVPEEALRQAPMSVNNRLSYTLGLKPKDTSDHRISSIYYPRALGDLLRIQPSPPVLKTPQMSAVKSESPHSTADYFSAHVNGSAATLVPMEGDIQGASKSITPEREVPRIAVRSPAIPPETKRVVSSQAAVLSSPGLNSHPSVMTMATAPPMPVELPLENEHQERRFTTEELRRGSKSTLGPLSSLGEPGPEVANSEYEGEVSHSEPLPLFNMPAAQPGKPARIMSGMDLPEIVMDSLAAVDSHPASPRPEQIALPMSPPLGSSVPGTPQSERGYFVNAADHATPRAGTPIAKTSPLVNGESREDLVDSSKPAPEASPRQVFVAELEGHVPATPTSTTPLSAPVTTFPDGPVEMEAPAAHFVLPPRASAKEIKVEQKAVPTVKQRAIALRAAAKAKEKEEAFKPRDFNRDSVVPEPIRPLKLRLAKMDGKMVPVQAHSPDSEVLPGDGPRLRSPRLSADIISSILDTMADTPATSPTVEVPQSDISTPSVVRVQRSSKQFGPPESAPPPPGPGGRSMVNPDYANAGAFDGERKTSPRLSKRHSANGKATSISGIRELISGATSRRHSSESVKTRNHSISSPGVGTDMIDPSGKDVLWFNLKSSGKTRASPAVPA